MPTSTELQVLYQHFDRLIDLPLAEQARELDAFRRSGDPLALQLEGMLIYHQHQNPTESLFSVHEMLNVVQSELPRRIASDLRELSRRLRWDGRSGCFQLGHFSLFQCLSVSTIGATYHARDQELDRDVVLLLLFPRWSETSEVQHRSLDASRAVAKIFDSHVAAILGTIKLEGIFAVIRQWIPGMNLDQWLARRESVSLEEILHIGRGIVLGLQSIHNEQVLHGDLKPANIILRRDSLHPVITDFGTATWISPTDSTKWHGGTKGFVAPEILRNEPPSPQSDLYSLGVILQWMITGVADRESTDSDWERASKRLFGKMPESESLQRFKSFRGHVSSLLSPEPTTRPRDATSVASVLADCSAGAGDAPSIPERTDRGDSPSFWKQPRNRRQWIGHAMGLGLSATAAAAGGQLLAKQRESQPAVFVPGTPSNVQSDCYVERLPVGESAAFIPGSLYPVDKGWHQGAGLGPTRPGRWVWLTMQTIELPSTPQQVALLQFVLHFDTDPGQAFYCVKGCLDARTNDWLLLSEGVNLFGGYHTEWVAAHFGPIHLANAKSLHLRFGMMFTQPARYQTDLPPVALRVLAESPPYLAGSIDFWEQLGVRPKSEQG